jgi:hypothetical protein
MKKAFFFLAVISFFILGCDKVEVPQQAGGSEILPATDTIRKILIEDFTGHLCQNCPPAARMMDSLERAYPGQIIGVAVHYDFWAAPCLTPQDLPQGAPPGSFTEDFRVAAEDAAYQATFTTSNFYLPAGLINRSNFFPSLLPVQLSGWSSTVATLLAQPMTAYLKITPSYNSASRMLNVNVTGEFMTDTTGNYNVALFLVEDSLIGYQKDASVSIGGLVANYRFDHVFRGCINTPGNITGDPVIAGTISAHTGINYMMPNAFHVSNSFNDQRCKIVAFLYKTSDQGVLQAAECDLR